MKRRVRLERRVASPRPAASNRPSSLPRRNSPETAQGEGVVVVTVERRPNECRDAHSQCELVEAVASGRRQLQFFLHVT